MAPRKRILVESDSEAESDVLVLEEEDFAQNKSSKVDLTRKYSDLLQGTGQKRSKSKITVEIIPESSKFQTTKQSKKNKFSDFSYTKSNNKKPVKRRRRIRKEVESSEDEISSINSDISDSESESNESESSDEENKSDGDSHFEMRLGDDDQVTKLFEKCEKISHKLRKKCENIEKNERENFVSEQEAEKLFPNSLKLKPYQLVGLNWLHLMYTENVNGVLADEMGLGKTIQSMALLALLKKRYEINGLFLVVAPGSTLENWRRELSTWLPTHKVAMYHGSVEERDKVQRMFSSRSNNQPKVDILLTTYTFFEREGAQSKDDRTFFYSQNYEYVIFDEAHAIKNLKSQRYKRLVNLKAKRKLLLSGTLVQNSLNELLATLSFAMPSIFKAEQEQLAEFFGTDCDEKDINRLKKAIEPFILRRLKVDVLKQMPNKKEIILKVKMTETQRQIYSDAIESYKMKKKVGFSNKDAMNIFTFLRKACNHPLLVQNKFRSVVKSKSLVEKLHKIKAFGAGARKDMISKEIEEYSDWQLHVLLSEYSSHFKDLLLDASSIWESAKFLTLRKLIPELKTNGHRIVMFSQWTTILDILEEFLNMIQISFVRFDGQTAIKERQSIVDNFNSNQNITVFLLSTRAGGLGINLTSADTVIIHDLDFNPTVDQQACDRVHRIGQTKEVTVYKLISEGTVDEGIHSLQEKKKELDEKLFKKEVKKLLENQLT